MTVGVTGGGGPRLGARLLGSRDLLDHRVVRSSVIGPTCGKAPGAAVPLHLSQGA